MKKRILYFMPDNPSAGKAGNLTRCTQMLNYLESLPNIEVDFLSIGDWGDWDKKNKTNFLKKHPNVRLHLINRKGSKTNKIKQFFEYKLLNIFPKLTKGTSVDITNPMLNRKVSNFIDRGNYDKVIISYASWAKVISNIRTNPYLIVDTHDFITAQSKDKTGKIGKLFLSEINILKKFDEIWTYSVEEEYIFEQFTDKKTTLIPISFPFCPTEYKENYKYELIFIGSLNPHNIKGIQWFEKEVLPFLEDTKIHIIGKICKVISDHPNFVKHGIVDDLEEFYQNTKVVICPMLSGTGIKIKVLEALSHSLPIVTNRRGVDGLLNKKSNGCIVESTGKGFAKAILRLLKDESFYLEKKKEAETYFLENHIFEREKEVLDNIFLGNE
ncbi:glycosyltransferase [uncultured Capnocytophaga sp.]|uniref:glycosyltransferase n=1 Tax=uncultured Capnocytophaga sp. TaxID=159273 RepID=UPI00260AC285|nr:glycosyltransferase [uncultured Capnocytophaga sp.]